MAMTAPVAALVVGPAAAPVAPVARRRRRNQKIPDHVILSAVQRSPAWANVLTTAGKVGLDSARTQDLLSLFVTNMRVRGDEGVIHFSKLKAALVSLGLPQHAAHKKIRDALMAVTHIPGFNRDDNNFFRLSAKAELSDERMNGAVDVKRDGVNEVLQAGNDPVSIRIRQLIPAMAQIIEDTLCRGEEWVQERKVSEQDRKDASHILRGTIEEVLQCTTKAAVGHVRNLIKVQHDTLGIADKNVEGYKTATRALATTFANEGEDVMPGGVVANMTNWGVSNIESLTGAMTNDIRNRAREIKAAGAAGSPAQKRKLNAVATERAKKYKKFNVFHVDVSKACTQESEMDCVEQCNAYCNKPREMMGNLLG